MGGRILEEGEGKGSEETDMEERNEWSFAMICRSQPYFKGRVKEATAA